MFGNTGILHREERGQIVHIAAYKELIGAVHRIVGVVKYVFRKSKIFCRYQEIAPAIIDTEIEHTHGKHLLLKVHLQNG